MYFSSKKETKKLLPIILESKFFIIYSYPLFLGLAIGICYFFSKHFFELKKISVPFNWLFLGVFVSSWIFAKLFFLWFSTTELQSEIYVRQTYFWLGGGFVFYGGLIGAILFLLIYSKFTTYKFNNSYLFIPGAVLAHGVGRIGCFLAGCCYGIRCDLPWKIYLNGEFRHPVQLYEAIFLFSLGSVLIKKIKHDHTNENIILTYLISYSVFRFIIEFFRGDIVRGHVFEILSSSQLVSLLIVVGCLIYFIFFRQKQTS